MRKSTFFLGALMAVGLTACTQSDDLASLESSLAGSSSLLKITTSGSNVTTRFDASTGHWESEDAIGVYMTNSDGTLQGSGYDNVEYTISDGVGSSSATFTSETGILKPDDGVTVNFYAYYPYSDTNVSDGVYSLNISDQSDGFEDYDLMYASEGSKTSDDLDDGLSLTFEHQVAKATIKVYTSLTLTEASISGVPTAIDFTINGGTSTTTTESGSIAPYGGEVSSDADDDDDEESTDDSDSTDSSSSDDDSSTDDYSYLYEAILLPMTDISNLTLKFTTDDGIVYSWSPTDLTSISSISAGYEYVFGIYIEYSSSTGSGSSDNYIYEVTATGTPFTSYTTDGLSGDATQASYADDLGIECIIDVDAASTGLSTLLTDTENVPDGTTAVALRFSSSETYASDLGAIDIPSTITTLALICDNTEAASINLEGLSNGSSLENLYLYNLDITGTSGTSFVYNCNITGTISVEDCSITSVDELFNLNYPSAYTEDTTDDLTLIVKNSVINATTLITGGVVTCTLENSTFTTTSYLMVASSGVQACDLSVDACTFDVATYLFSLPSSYENTADDAGNTNSMSYTNNVVAYNGSSYFMDKVTCSTYENSYHVSSDDTTNIYATAHGQSSSSYSGGLNGVSTGVDTYDVLFSEEYNSVHSLDDPTYWLTSDYSEKETGDPRWYYSNHTSSEE